MKNQDCNKSKQGENMESLQSFEHYECVITPKLTGSRILKRIAVIFGYLIFASFWFVLAMRVILNAYIVALAVFSTAILIALTWKYLKVEYEYSFESGILQLSKIYGKRKRKTLYEIELRTLLLAGEANEENLRRAEALNPTESIQFLSSERSDTAWFAVWDEEKGKRMILYFEGNERIRLILRHYNSQALIRNFSSKS